MQWEEGRSKASEREDGYHCDTQFCRIYSIINMSICCLMFFQHERTLLLPSLCSSAPLFSEKLSALFFHRYGSKAIDRTQQINIHSRLQLELEMREEKEKKGKRTWIIQLLPSLTTRCCSFSWNMKIHYTILGSLWGGRHCLSSSTWLFWQPGAGINAETTQKK